MEIFRDRVDAGIATGFTMLAACEYLRRQEVSKLIVATPVAAMQAAQTLSEVADEVIVLVVPNHFCCVGEHYKRFRQTRDETVKLALARNRRDPL